MNGYLISSPKNYHPLYYWFGYLINYICGGNYFSPKIKCVIFIPEVQNNDFIPNIKSSVLIPSTKSIQFTPTSKSFTYKPKG